MIRVVLPAHLRTLARVDREVKLEIEGQPTLGSALDALEAPRRVLDHVDVGIHREGEGRDVRVRGGSRGHEGLHVVVHRRFTDLTADVRNRHAHHGDERRCGNPPPPDRHGSRQC